MIKTMTNLLGGLTKSIQISCSRSISLKVSAPSTSIKLNSISDNFGATKERTRVGRGRSSGHGKTCGRGQKGQKARTGNGKPKLGFEGGQTPLKKLAPKRGFTNVHAYDMKPLRMNRIQRWIELGRLDPTKTITLKHLLDSKCIHKFKDGVKLLGDGSEYLTQPIDIQVSQATKQAIETVEARGGSLTTVYFNQLGLRAHLRPDKFHTIPKIAKPTKGKDMAYYTNPENRGYLAKKSDIESKPE